MVSSSSNAAAAPKPKRAKWTDDDDKKLKEYVKREGAKNWDEVAKNLGLSKTGNSCYLRWKNHLKPEINKGPFTEEEVAKIINLRNVYGENKWSKIASELPRRNANQVKNYWYTYLSKKNAESIPQNSDQVHQVDDDEELIQLSDIFTEEDLEDLFAIIGYN